MLPPILQLPPLKPQDTVAVPNFLVGVGLGNNQSSCSYARPFVSGSRNTAHRKTRNTVDPHRHYIPLKVPLPGVHQVRLQDARNK